MNPEYEFFECLPDGSLSWHDSVEGLINTRRHLRELTRATDKEYVAIEVTTRKVIFPVVAPALAKRVYQIAYHRELKKQTGKVAARPRLRRIVRHGQ